MLSVRDFEPKGTISKVSVHTGAKINLDIRDAGRSQNAVGDHAGTAQVDFQVDRPSPAHSPPGDLLITMVKETVILFKFFVEVCNLTCPLITFKRQRFVKLHKYLQVCKVLHYKPTHIRCSSPDLAPESSPWPGQSRKHLGGNFNHCKRKTR